jgi:hypothetical protein
MTVWILVMHLLMADGSVVTTSEEVTVASVEECLDIGKAKLNELHALHPDSTSGLHFCLKKDRG